MARLEIATTLCETSVALAAPFSPLPHTPLPFYHSLLCQKTDPEKEACSVASCRLPTKRRHNALAAFGAVKKAAEIVAENSAERT
jgi:hypothetical protein